MRIAYVNANYQQNHTGGGQAHMEQFVLNATKLGHEVWIYRGNAVPGVHIIPVNRLDQIKTLRSMDAFYVRIDSGFPRICEYSLPPRRWLYKLPVVAWEFNTVPEHGLLRSQNHESVQRSIRAFQKYGKGIDLAVCVSDDLAKYVQQNLGIKHVMVVPNGSDPDLFRPDVQVVPRLTQFKDKVNVVWIGSGKEPWHDLQTLKNAAQIICTSPAVDRISFHIIGPDLTGIMADMPANLYYWGAEHYQKLPHWLAGMQIGLILYHPGPADFNSPLKFFDYLASGLAVISTPQPVINSFLETFNQTDMLVPSGSPEHLAQAIMKLAEDLQRIKKLGMIGRQTIIDHYNWKRAVSDTMCEIENLLTRKQNHG